MAFHNGEYNFRKNVANINMNNLYLHSSLACLTNDFNSGFGLPHVL